ENRTEDRPTNNSQHAAHDAGSHRVTGDRTESRAAGAAKQTADQRSVPRSASTCTAQTDFIDRHHTTALTDASGRLPSAIGPVRRIIRIERRRARDRPTRRRRILGVALVRTVSLIGNVALARTWTRAADDSRLDPVGRTRAETRRHQQWQRGFQE